MGLGKESAKLEGCPRVIQILVFIFNFIFFVLGLALIGVGAKVLIENKSYDKILEMDYLQGAKLAIAVGVIVALIAFLGCCGACLLNKCLLMTFFVLMLIIVILDIVAVALGYAFYNKAIAALDKGLEKSFANYNQSGHESVTKAIDEMQQQLKCCGVNGTGSWKTPIPDSCCEGMAKGCASAEKQSKQFKPGCTKQLKKWFKDNLPIVGGIAIGVLLIELLAIIFSLVLFCQAKKLNTFA